MGQGFYAIGQANTRLFIDILHSGLLPVVYSVSRNRLLNRQELPLWPLEAWLLNRQELLLWPLKAGC